MTDGALKLVFRGVRGSTRAATDAHTRTGGHGSCLELRLAADHWLILDAGSGLSAVERNLPEARNLRFDILLSHCHWDHIEGLPFFGPLYRSDCRLDLHGVPWMGRDLETLLTEAIRPPYFPVPLAETASSKRFKDLGEEPFDIGPVRVRTARLRHPQGAIAFRLEHGDSALVYATDHEPGDEDRDKALIALAEGARYLVLDAQYLPEEYPARRGRGHGTWEHAVEIARRAEVERLLLFHHDPSRSDEQIDRIEALARPRFPSLEAAREGAVLEF